MSYAFSGALGKNWTDEVTEYLVSEFNSDDHLRVKVLSKSVFDKVNVALAQFDDVPFIINGDYECLELSFAKADTDKINPVIQRICGWKAFTRYSSRFLAKVDKGDSRSIFFDSGKYQSPGDFKRYFHNYDIEILY